MAELLEPIRQSAMSVAVDEIQPAKTAYPVIEDALLRYSRERRRGFTQKSE